ncbi:DUF4249 domain-containing protein [Marinigracilibium pacificum]|uniref:DUF4249 domain-containing protein n=1 Tax=Marinigracilibium pacificum TaxID=2729599 RepID=A0A848IYV7_9BACT|nr:DUF4249 domain-containing protein [Marinigracilibium pacificum]NMM49457.1 DUF4249 domain-containing protein [Marinigracilibium pacificum]
MKRNLKYILSIIFVLIVASCQEEVKLKLTDGDPQLVVEAKITTQSGPHLIKLGLTTSYYDEKGNDTVRNAQVRLVRGDDYIVPLEEKNPGYFYTADDFSVVEGEKYTLEIDYNGQQYSASGEVLPYPVLDSVVVRYQEERVFREEGYYCYFYGKTPKGQINYYRWLVYENDTLFNDRGDYLLADDELVQEDISNLELPYPFEVGDTVKVEQYSLNESTYNYFLGLVNLLFNDGGIFSPAPVNPTTNISNITDPGNPPLGFFQISSVTSITILIEEEE